MSFALLPFQANAFNVQISRAQMHLSSPAVIEPVRFQVIGGLEEPVRTIVRDSQGRRVGILQRVSEETLVWDGRDPSGKLVTPGEYYVEIEAGSYLWSSVFSVGR